MPGEAGCLLREAGLTCDIAYTSVRKRAIKTLWIVLEEMDLMWIPVSRQLAADRRMALYRHMAQLHFPLCRPGEKTADEETA
ncbi:MAG TPA: hypothetical protein VFG28_14650 [Syntrophales bacterium]|nr:hypothetical protein [Syntrophales bacterium]